MTGEGESLFAGHLRGTVARVLFESRDSGWVVMHLDREDGPPATVVGPLAPVVVGESLDVEGSWELDARYGQQFRATACTSLVPDTVEGTRRYLGSGVLPGIGPELAARLVNRFGADTLRILDEEPDRLLAVRGIGAKRLTEIKGAWVQRSAQRQARIFLQGHGLGPALTERVLRAWGDEALARVKRQPYDLVAEVRGIGFRTADALALRMGWAPDAPERVRAGVMHVLAQAADAGDCYVPGERTERATVRLLELPAAEGVPAAVAELVSDRKVVVEQDTEGSRVYSAYLHGAEQRVARRLALLASQARRAGADDAIDGIIRQAEHDLRVELSPEQRRAVSKALRLGLLVVTGGPGTGKTTLVNVLVRCADALGLRVALTAPTGRAAKRLEQATGRAGVTMHRLLEYRFEEGFTRGSDNPVEADLLVVDEASMVDLPLMDAFTAAVAPGTRVLLVGDADQLPPVGPGAVLRDLLDSGCLATERLRTIYRQAQQSLIVRNAHKINAGELPEAPEEGGALSDFYLIEEGDGDRARELVLRLATERIPQRFGLDPRRDIQVLAPMHRGRCGVARLNQALQQALNPGGSPSDDERIVLRPGDRVMQLRNDYDREVFNGDIGAVVDVDDDEGVMVEFDGRLVGYERASLADLALAYATSVHKSQGSEYPGVIAVLLPEHRIMLQRNLLYTALTRAREVAVLVTTREALRIAVGNAAPSRRCTTLAERIRQTWSSAGLPFQASGQPG